MGLRNKLNVRQVAGLTKPGVYTDGGGPYLRIRSGSAKSWVFIGLLRGKRREMGLGSIADVSLANCCLHGAVMSIPNFLHLNRDWNAEPNAPGEKVVVKAPPCD